MTDIIAAIRRGTANLGSGFAACSAVLLFLAGNATASEVEWREHMRLARAAYVDERFEGARDGYDAAAAAARIRPEANAAGPQAVALANAAIARLDVGDLHGADAAARRAMEIMDAAPPGAVSVGDQVEILEARGRTNLFLSKFPNAYEACAKGRNLADIHLAQHDRRRLQVESCIYQWEMYWLDAPIGPPDPDSWAQAALIEDAELSSRERIAALGPVFEIRRQRRQFDVADALAERLGRTCRNQDGSALLGCQCEADLQRFFTGSARSLGSEAREVRAARMRAELEALSDSCKRAFGSDWHVDPYLRNAEIMLLSSEGKFAEAKNAIRIQYGVRRVPLAAKGFCQAVVIVNWLTDELDSARHCLWRVTELADAIYGQSHPKAVSARQEAAKYWDILGESETARLLRQQQ